MKVFASVKQAGKRKDYITRKELFLDHAPVTLRELIVMIVQNTVEEYNSKTVEPAIIHYLLPEKMVAPNSRVLAIF